MIPIHNILEMASILLGFTLFLTAWHGSINNNSHKIKIASVILLFTSVIDLTHVMSYSGFLDTLIKDANWLTWWIISRLMWSGALLYVVYKPGETICKFKTYLVYGFLITASLTAFNIFQRGWHYLKIDDYQNWLVLLALGLALIVDTTIVLILRCRYKNYTASDLLRNGIFFNILTNASFLFSIYFEMNMPAHLFKLFASYFVLRAVFYYVVKSPYEDLKKLKEKLEELVTKNAKLYKASEQQRNLVEDTLAKIGAIISSQLNLKDTLDAIADMVADMMNARQSLIALFSNDQSHLQVVASYGINTPPNYLPLNESLSGQVIEQNKSLFIGDLSQHPDIFRPQLIFSNICSTICAPLVNEGQVIGIIEAYSSEIDAFNDRDALLLTALAHYAGSAIASAMLYEETKLRLEEERHLSEITQAAAATIDTGTIMEQCTAHIIEALSADVGLGLLSDSKPGLLTSAATVNFNYKLPAIDLADYPKLNEIVSTLKPSTVPAEVFPPLVELYDQNAARHIMVLPLALNNNLLGLIIIGWQRFFATERLKRLSFAALMAQQIALGLEKARLYNQVKSMALSDGLTGLANRRNFDMFLKTELRRAATLKRPLSLIMLDLDKFKTYNDTYGHLTGDKLLAQIGQLLHTTVRSIDLPARYGGEEFSVILPECGNSEAVTIAEKLRRAIEEGHFPDHSGTFTARITASLGVATYDPTLGLPLPDAESIIAVADKTLYQAKQEGRNRVIASNIID